jgi:hypothetical protein
MSTHNTRHWRQKVSSKQIQGSDVLEFRLNHAKSQSGFSFGTTAEVIVGVDSLRAPSLSSYAVPMNDVTSCSLMKYFEETEQERLATRHRKERETQLFGLMLQEYLSRLPEVVVTTINQYYKRSKPVVYMEFCIETAQEHSRSFKLPVPFKTLLSKVKYVFYPSQTLVSTWNQKYNRNNTNPNAIKPKSHAKQMKQFVQFLQSHSQHRIKAVAIERDS